VNDTIGGGERQVGAVEGGADRPGDTDRGIDGDLRRKAEGHGGHDAAGDALEIGSSQDTDEGAGPGDTGQWFTGC
jgi:hypothetical protein